jgi:hypothetical protein
LQFYLFLIRKQRVQISTLKKRKYSIAGLLITILLDFSFEDSLLLSDRGKSILELSKQGDLQGIRDLGCAYIWGEDGFPQDKNRARFWYTIAADAGNTEAMWDVSTMYFNGEGGLKNIDRGMKYLYTAAKRKRWSLGVEEAAELLAEIFEKGYYDRAIDLAEAKKWKNIGKLHNKRYRGWRRKHT